MKLSNAEMQEIDKMCIRDRYKAILDKRQQEVAA